MGVALDDDFILDLAEQTNGDPEGFMRSLESTLERTSDSQKAKILLKAGNVLYDHSYFPHSLTSWNNALDFYITIRDLDFEAVCYSNIGRAYKQLGQYQKALEYHEKALAINKEIGDRNGEAAGYNNIGTIYYSIGQNQKALEYHEKLFGLI
jgi:tetratricopeptide (TPR) repeat protein